jgi:hypothetical protein
MQDESGRVCRTKKLGIVMIAQGPHLLNDLDMCVGGLLIGEAVPISLLPIVTFYLFYTDKQFATARIAEGSRRFGEAGWRNIDTFQIDKVRFLDL